MRGPTIYGVAPLLGIVFLFFVVRCSDAATFRIVGLPSPTTTEFSVVSSCPDNLFRFTKREHPDFLVVCEAFDGMGPPSTIIRIENAYGICKTVQVTRTGAGQATVFTATCRR